VWDGGPTGTGTNWHTAENWVGDVLPGAGDDVEIGAAFAATTITSNADVTINSIQSEAPLTLSNGDFSVAAASTLNSHLNLSGAFAVLTGAGDLTLNGGLTWSAGTMRGAGTTILPQGAAGAITGTVSQKILGRWFDNAGSLTYSGTRFVFGVSASELGLFSNLPQGVFTVSGEGDLGHSSGPGQIFDNQGTFIRSGPGATVFSTVRFDNAGLVQVQEGTLGLDIGSQTGDFELADGVTLILGDDNTFAAGSDLVGDGYHLQVLDGDSSYAGAINTSGTLTFTDGSLTMAGPVSAAAAEFTANENGTAVFNHSAVFQSLTLSAGTLTGSGDVRVTTALTWTDGKMIGTGKTILEATALGTIAGDQDLLTTRTLGRRLDNAGTLTSTAVRLTFGASAAEPGVLTNLPGARFTASGTGEFRRFAGTNAFNNQGDWVRTGAGETVFTNVPFHNTGAVHVRAGNLRLSADSTMQFDGADWLSLPADSLLTLDSSLTGDTTNVTQFSLAGTTRVSGGTSGAPRLLEVMGADLGPMVTGFDANFALGLSSLPAPPGLSSSTPPIMLRAQGPRPSTWIPWLCPQAPASTSTGSRSMPASHRSPPEPSWAGRSLPYPTADRSPSTCRRPAQSRSPAKWTNGRSSAAPAKR
jgi:hypothetical protein